MIAQIVALLVLLLLPGVTVYASDCNNGGRYEDNGDGTVTDCRGGLIWLKDADCPGTTTWYNAMAWAAGLASNSCGLTDGSAAGDWRLPTQEELMAMVSSALKQGMSNPRLTDGTGTGHWAAGNANNVFTNVQSKAYWSVTTLPGSPDMAWFVWMGNTGDLIPAGAKSASSNFHAWPVRAGQSGAFGFLFVE